MLRALGLASATLLLAAVSAQAATWTILPGQSSLGFTGSQSGAAFSGHFGKFSGTIVFDPAHPEAGHAAITIETASAATGDPQKDGALPGADWFDASRFPKAQFIAKSFRQTGPGAYEADGTLTIRGIAKPLALPFALTIAGDEAKAKGAVDLTRTDYGVGQGAWSSGQYVALKVAVSFAITARRTGP